MVAMPSEANWQVTFPGNLRWSNATQIVKGMVAYGAAAAAEIDQITRRLKARSGEAKPYHPCCLLRWPDSLAHLRAEDGQRDRLADADIVPLKPPAE